MPKQVKKNKNVKKTATQGAKKTVKKAVKSTKTVKSPKKATQLAPVAAPVFVVAVPEKTQAEKIWDNIKDKNIEMFALPGQTPAKYCKPIQVEPNKLYLTFTVSAVLPALEEAFKATYDVELVDRYIVMTVKPNVAKR